MTKIVTIELESPIMRGETEIKTLQLRKPASGELRGLSLTRVLNMDTDILFELLPRITIPPLVTPEIEGMDVADLTACAHEIADFFTPVSLKPKTV